MSGIWTCSFASRDFKGQLPTKAAISAVSAFDPKRTLVLALAVVPTMHNEVQKRTCEQK